MLNRTIHEVKQSIGKPIINNLPELEIPDFMDSISLLHENSQPIYNLEKIIELQKNDYMDTLYWLELFEWVKCFQDYGLYCSYHSYYRGNRNICIM